MKTIELRWLQLSDIHTSYNTEWRLMREGYVKLYKKFKPDFIVITGDFCKSVNAQNYAQALEVLNDLVGIFSLSKERFFLVPGNHDVSEIPSRHEDITTIRCEIKKDSDVYLKYIDKLKSAFNPYVKFVKEFYGDSLPNGDMRVEDPAGTFLTTLDDKLNIVSINTALASGKGKKEILDINALNEITSKLADSPLPTIAIAHHSFSSIIRQHYERLDHFLTTIPVKAYLCGDEHKVRLTHTDCYNISNLTYCIVCGKSSPRHHEQFSDVCVVAYTWTGERTSVQVYKWQGNVRPRSYEFIKDHLWYIDDDTPFSFPMCINKNEALVSSNQFSHMSADVFAYFDEIDAALKAKMGDNKIINKLGDLEIFKSERIMRSLIEIGVPFCAGIKIVQTAASTLLNEIHQGVLNGRLETKTIRFKVLEAIQLLDIKDFTRSEIVSWTYSYIRKYGHNDREILFCNVPKSVNKGKTSAGVTYEFISCVFLPDVFKRVCPTLDFSQLPRTQKDRLSHEVCKFLSDCDLYLLDYKLMRRMVSEMITKPPHPWIINDSQREKIISYDRESVETKLSKLANLRHGDKPVPNALLIDILHHTSALVLDCYFNFFGCFDLDSYEILRSYIVKLKEREGAPYGEWDSQCESPQIRKLMRDFSEHNIGIDEYLTLMDRVNPKKLVAFNSQSYISYIMDFAKKTLNIIDAIGATLK